MTAPAVLFDLDGTLTNSEEAIANSYHYVCNELALPPPSDDQIRSFIGPPLEVTWSQLAPDATTAARAVALYRERYTRFGAAETTVYPGIVEMLDALSKDKVRLAVATSKDESIAQAVLEHFGLSDRFDAVVGATRDGTRHHKVDVIAETLHRLGLRPDGVAMVGDRDHDMLAARQHGLVAVGVLWGFGDRQELAEAGAQWLIEKPDDLPGVLASSGCF
jgi:phosphoglycolate phosphatase